MNNVNISIKGANEDEYVANTGTTGFLQVVEGFHNLQKLGIKPGLSYVLLNQSTEDLQKLKNSFVKYKLNNLIFQLYKPSVNETNGYTAPSLFELADVCLHSYKVFNNSFLNFKYEMSIPLCLLDEDLLNILIENKQINTCCHISKGLGIIFDTNFNILPCNHFVNHYLNTEEVKTEDIIKFWNSENVKRFRKVIKTYPALKCQTCEKWKFCGGGCFLRWLHLKPENFII